MPYISRKVSRVMLDIVTLDRDPEVPALLIDGEARSGEPGIGEGADGHGDEIVMRAALIIDGEPHSGQK
jgi:hypothetical protein